MIHYKHCPACGNEAIAPLSAGWEVVDYTVSHQRFAIWHCRACSLRFTQDVPPPEAIGPYYQSEAYISHSDTQKGLVNRLYHLVRKRTLQGKRRLVERAAGRQQGRLLDVGCGTGAFLHTMQLAGWQVTGLEPDARARQKAADLYGLQPLAPDAFFDFAPSSFHVVTLWHVLEHVHNLQGYLRQMRHVLEPGGRLIIAVPNYTSYDATVYGPHWAAWDVPRHLYHFSPQAMQGLLEQHGFRLTQMHPMWYDSFYVSMLSEQYKNGKGNLIRAFFNGLRSNIKAMRNKGRCSSVIYVAELPKANVGG